MKTMVYNTFVVVLALMFQVSTGGILVYVHHCQHEQETYTSLFIEFGEGEDHPCSHGTAETKSCCGNAASTFESTCDASCCTDMALLLKFTPDTEPIPSGKTLPAPLPIESACNVNRTASVDSGDETTVFFEVPPEKPPISGRKLVILYQQIKIDLMA